jgi:hypothetical protein
MTTGWTHTRWMTALPDDIPISELSIPGTHNSAAINMIGPTPWACQCHSITEQLKRGIRLLDIRLKPKPRTRSTSQTGAPTLPQNDFEFQTCHGRLGLFGANEFQSFDEIQKECSDFLKENPGETIIMIVKIDDWRSTRPAQRPLILQKLGDLVRHLPLLTVPYLPTLGECRGRLYLINRINDDPALGNQYKALNYRNPEAHKLRLTLGAFNHKSPGAVLLNFASATKPVFQFVYIMRELITQLDKPSHLQYSGWLFLDYALTTYATGYHETLDLPTLFIAANFK